MSTLLLVCLIHQKGALDPFTDGCEPPCGCWELNSGPLEEQSVLLTAEPRLFFLQDVKPGGHGLSTPTRLKDSGS